jgi:hypothetical protein
VLGLPAGAAGHRLRLTAAVLAVSGVALAGTAAGLAATARLGPRGIFIPALHDAASDQPIPYTPVCGPAAGVTACLHPAYHRYLADVQAALAPVLHEVAGLPGAPARAAQVPGTYASGNGSAAQPMTISGDPPVLHLRLDSLSTLPGSVGFTAARQTTSQFGDEMRALFAHAFAGAGPGPGTPAQQAVQAALLQGAGVPFSSQPKTLAIAGLLRAGPDGPGPATGPVYTAAKRFAALPAAAQRSWLAAHLAALRSGRLSLGQIP